MTPRMTILTSLMFLHTTILRMRIRTTMKRMMKIPMTTMMDIIIVTVSEDFTTEDTMHGMTIPCLVIGSMVQHMDLDLM